ncbi:hypothetical protein EM854_24090 (plasmid) [Escherichia coli]|nr:hypothetical protein [Escherichia coli]AZU87664.1 hypothetical protein EM854_24090 [Escherichia coli]
MKFFAPGCIPPPSARPSVPPSARTAQATGGFHCTHAALRAVSRSSLSSITASSAGNTTPSRPRSLLLSPPPSCGAALRLFTVLCFDSQERREAPRLVHRLDTRGVGLYRRQPVAVPAVPCHLRFTRQRHPPVRSRSRRHTRFAIRRPSGS